MTFTATQYEQLDQWIDTHFDEQIAFLSELVKVPTDTPPGNNAPHALRTAQLLEQFGMHAQQIPIPKEVVQEAGLESITNLIVRREYGAGPTIALNAHGDVVPPGEGWTHDPYGAEIVDGVMYGRATAVSKCDFSTFTFAVRALESLNAKLKGNVELHFTYDEEFGGELGPGWLLSHKLTQPDLMIAAGFSYQVITAHNGCLQLEVTVHGQMAHAAIPDSGVDALQGALPVLQKLYEQNKHYKEITSSVEGITHPYLNIGKIDAGTNTNVIPGKVVFKLDRRMIPEEDPTQVEETLRALITKTVDEYNRPLASNKHIRVEIKRILLARSMRPLGANAPLVHAIQKHAKTILHEDIPALGTPLYTDVRLYTEHGIPGVIYGAGPRTVLESHAKRADERLNLNDLRAATKIIARTLADLLST
jgi:acetylornithine deacetylase/succinyl-diaminopimelate desuccinylase-like protein